MWLSALKLEITRQHSEKLSKNARKQQPAENQTNADIQAKWGPGFTFSLPRGAVCTPDSRLLRHLCQRFEMHSACAKKLMDVDQITSYSEQTVNGFPIKRMPPGHRQRSLCDDKRKIRDALDQWFPTFLSDMYPLGNILSIRHPLIVIMSTIIRNIYFVLLR